MSDKSDSDLERAEELFAFLQGKIPEGIRLRKSHIPTLTAEQAWSVIWYLGELHWQVPDHIERCGVCGDLYDSNDGGHVLDFGEPPHFFCDGCYYSDAYQRKEQSKP